MRLLEALDRFAAVAAILTCDGILTEVNTSALQARGLHRAKNSLATILAIASQTINTASDLESFRKKFSGRLQAMAIAQDTIFANNDITAELAQVITTQLASFAEAGSDRLRLKGPRVLLEPGCVHGISLVIHELATNGSKYGALSTDGGVLDIVWDVFAQGGTQKIELSWTETGGPPVTPPEKSGFGTRLIETMLVQTLNGTIRFDYRRAGLRAEMSFEVPNLRGYGPLRRAP